MAHLDDDVDFKKLVKEVSNALAKDEKYQRENDAKFRAINQKVKSYEEFRDIVDASHLKPLYKTDKIGGMSYQCWNHLATVEVPAKSKETTEKETLTPVCQPTNAYDFSRTWKRICITPTKKCEFLLSINLQLLKKCLETDCMLGDIISVLEANVTYCKNKTYLLLSIFEVIASTSRFSLALQFLSANELLSLKSIFSRLQQESEGDSDLSARFSKLSSLYEVS